MGTFTEFLPGTSLVQPLYSLDGETWQICRQMDWRLQWLGSEAAEDLKMLQNQSCLFDTHEPLDRYLAGELDRFYLKLSITLDNGITYETQAATVERGDPQPLPEELSPVANLARAILVQQWRPFNRYGQYQITVSADATPEDIFALLPDTLPVNVQLYQGINFATDATVDCPVTWKSLSLPQLTAGENVTITDAAEDITVPAGTLLNTPTGIFQLDEALGIEHDEIRLILNVVAADAEPTGVLSCEIDGLQVSFHLKPTGATAIQTYTFSESGADWVKLPNPLLPEEVNTPSSAANSTYTYVLYNTSEPYQAYLAAENAGVEPVPFFVGLKIEGGVYDGRQLILAWPNNYELPARLPDLKGSGGNECNAGSDNKNDSTLEGQRPDLPHQADNKAEAPETLSQSQDQGDKPAAPEPLPPQDQEDEPTASEPLPPQDQGDEPAAPEPQQQSPDDEPVIRESPQAEPYASEARPETLPADGPESSALVPEFHKKIGSPAWEKTDHNSKHLFLRLILLTAATIVIGFGIAVTAKKHSNTRMER